METRVADLSVDELRDLIQDVVTQTLEELFRDPDIGLEVRTDFARELHRSLKAVQNGGQTLAAETVAANLGLSW